MKLALVVDFDSERPEEHRIRIQEVYQRGESSLDGVNDEDSEFDTLEKMRLLANGAGLLMRCAENEGLQLSHKSIKECIDVLEHWLSDSQAIAETSTEQS